MPTAPFDEAMAFLEAQDDGLWRYLLALEPEDRPLIAQVAGIVRTILTRPDLRPAQIASLARLLLGLNRLPLITPGVDVLVILSTGTSDDSYSHEIGIGEDRFWIGGGGYCRGPFGGDSYGSWTFEVEGSFHTDPDEAELEQLDEIQNIALDGAIAIQDGSDESQLAWEDDDGAPFWSFIERASTDRRADDGDEGEEADQLDLWDVL